jgi:DNA methylase
MGNSCIDKNIDTSLNGICAYFTMFPLAFPYSVLLRRASKEDCVMDPFCGRGTTNFASRILGLPSIGIDSSPVAAAVTEAKLVNATPQQILDSAQEIMEEISAPRELPTGEFWGWAFHKDVLPVLCRLREGLIRSRQSDSRKALLGILMGALHGPLTKGSPSYFSNQCPRTYAPKPAYSVRYWKARGLLPPRVNVLEVIGTRANRYYKSSLPRPNAIVVRGDSRDENTYSVLGLKQAVRWIITSPPYYGMRTYTQDQWLRSWFLGGEQTVQYSMPGEIRHGSPETFVHDLNQVWRNMGKIAGDGARLVVRFGGINHRKAKPREIIKESLKDSGWKIETAVWAGSASTGRRQALHFSPCVGDAQDEIDTWAEWQG